MARARPGKVRVAAGVAAATAAVLLAAAWIRVPRLSYLPAMDEVVNPQSLDVPVRYDTNGRSVSGPDTPAPDAMGEYSPERGDVRIDTALLRFGRQEFYRETFGNEVFLTEVMGILDGPLRPYEIAKAVLELGGKGTTDLRVELAGTVTIGGVTYQKGSKIDTGLDVPAGSSMVLGMPIRVVNGRLMAGITCAACHSTVDPKSGRVIDGAVNTDLAAGLLLALATNSAAYFSHAEIDSLDPFVRDRERTVATSDGGRSPLPDARELENAVDEIFASWPPGDFDSTIDGKADPTQIPDSFTRGDHPYGWSGFAAVGPFHGLSVLCNNVHAQNSDSLAQAELSKPMLGIDKEVYLATILQNAPSSRYRYDPASGRRASEFFASVDPTPGAPGINELIRPPGYPEVSWLAPDGVFLGSPGRRVWQQNNAMAAWQNTLDPPDPPVPGDEALAAHGRRVFERAGCAGCHAGAALTNNRIIPASQIRTEPTRARAFEKTESIFGPPLVFSFDTPIPVPANAKVMLVNMRGLDPYQLDLAWAHEGTGGGYKVPSLVGLFWSAPYLHDGGVAVGPHDELGVAATSLRGIAPSPEKSLHALVDRDLRAQVVAANDASAVLARVRVRGIGHEFWADAQAGFSPQDQRALVQYLMTVHLRDAEVREQQPIDAVANAVEIDRHPNP